MATRPTLRERHNGGVPSVHTVSTSVLDITYEESGPSDGSPVLLMHGFPYSVRGYDAAVELLTSAGCRCVVPAPARLRPDTIPGPVDSTFRAASGVGQRSSLSCSMHCRSTKPCCAVSTGAAGRRASSPRCGRSVAPAW